MVSRRSIEGPKVAAVMLLALAAWLWPLGVGGRMPVGGDVTQFSIGLMGFLHRSLGSGRLPYWNDLWGYGFPGIGESQMGVYYPPHLVLYSLAPTELAYTLSLVFHVAWGAMGAFWLGRLLGVSATGSALAGFVWSASGFFVVHIPHQWGYTVGSWMPWIWALGWRLISEEDRKARSRAGWLLAAALAMQVLPGHFQLAFVTQVGLLVLLAAKGEIGRQTSGRLALVGLGSIALAAMQLAPTARLASLASGDRDYEYLSGFAATPIHLVSYLAPALFHRSPLWRPVAWDPFHTSPEEHLAYIGLAPLWLAGLAVWRLGRKDRATRALLAVSIVTLLLSLGPYVPGFSWLCRLPGFSFFRAPARWGAATGLGLALLAGQGWDQLAIAIRPRRGLFAFAAVSMLAISAVLCTWELAVLATEGRGIPAVSAVFDRLQRTFPWSGDPTFARVMTEARRPRMDLSVQQDLARRGVSIESIRGISLIADRSGIYWRELRETALILASLALVGGLCPGRRALRGGILIVAAADLIAFGRDRPVDDGPIRSLVEQSPVLDDLSKRIPGGRILDATRNLPMVAGLGPISAYRTLDLPAMSRLTELGRGLPGQGEVAAEALRATGVAARVLDPFETASRGTQSSLPGWSVARVQVDPAMAGWLYGTAWVRSRPEAGSTFTVLTPTTPPCKAWRLAGAKPTDLTAPMGPLSLFRGAFPIAVTSPRPERLEVELVAGSAGMLVVSQLADPAWEAEWRPESGQARPVSIHRAFDGWQAVEIPADEAGTLVLVYPARVEKLSLAFSSACWLIWGGGMALAFRRGPRPPISDADQSSR